MKSLRQLIMCVSLALVGATPGPPALVSSSPALWAVNVDATKQKSLSVTFDQPMRPGFSSWLGRSSVAPDIRDHANISDDHLTYTLPVSLEQGKVYVFALNEKAIPGIGFQTEKG